MFFESSTLIASGSEPRRSVARATHRATAIGSVQPMAGITSLRINERIASCVMTLKKYGCKNPFSSELIKEKIKETNIKKYGVEKNKSLKIKYPNFISDELFPHFLRGVFDGDGHIDKKKYTISITGTKDLLFGIKEELDKKFNLAICIFPVKNSEIIYEFKITNMNDCITFLDYIYTDAILFIRRKYDVYQKYLNEPLQK